MRQRRLQELLVLLARVLAVGLLTLLFCQPFIPAAKQATLANRGAVEVLADNSGSMQALGQAQVALRDEAAAGATVIGRSFGTARFKLLGSGGGDMQQTAYLLAVAGRQSVARGWGSTDVRDALHDELRGPVYLFSDFQKSEAQPQVLQQVKNQGSVVLVPLVAKPTGNIYVDSVWLDDAFVRVRTNMALHLKFRNGGTAAVANCPVKVLLGDKQVAAFQVSVGAGQQAEATVQVQLLDTSLVLGQVVVQDAPVTFDNAYYFTMQPAAVINVVEIGEEPATRSVYGGEPLFAYSFTKSQSVDYEKLRRANLVLVREVPQLEAGLREALAKVVQRGGSVVVVPPADPKARASYHELFRGLGIGGEQWEPAADSGPARQEVVMPSGKDPFFKDVLGAQPQRVALPQVAPVLRVGRTGTDILRLRNGDGFLTEFNSGAGKTYIFAAPFARAYSDFTTHALFVPVLYRLAMMSYRTNQLPAYRLTTKALALKVATDKELTGGDAESYRLVHDSLTYIPVQRVQGGQLHLDMPVSLAIPGFYELRRQGKVVTTLAFNAAKRESELAAYSAAELRQLIGPNHPNVQVLENGARPETLARYRAGQTGQPLWRYCLLLLLLCLLAEGLLLRFGRQQAGRALVAA